jgi:hypothetical protein
MLPLLVKDGLTTAFIGSSLLYIILSLSFYDLFEFNGWKRSAQKLMVGNNVVVVLPCHILMSVPSQNLKFHNLLLSFL